MTTIKLKNGSGAPTAGDLAQGEPALDLTNKRLYTEDSVGTVIEVGTNPTSITTGDITATGTATFAGLATTADVSFGDNDKAVFGAGSDLQIYHDGSASYIKDLGTGPLAINTNGSEIMLTGQSGGEYMLRAIQDGAVELYHDAAKKLATTSTGIDVTGTAVTDGLTVDVSSGGATVTAASFKNNGSGANTKARLDFFAASTRYAGISGGYGASAPQMSFDISGTDVLDINSTGIDVTGSVISDGLTVDGNPVINGTSPQLFLQTGASNYNWQIAAQENVSDAFEISSGSADANATNDTYTKRLVIQQSGDISFYEDTGTTAKFFWDASAEALGIGTSSPATTLTVEGSGANGIELNRNGADATQSARLFFDSSTSGYAVTNVAGDLAFNSGATAGVSSGTERMRIDSSGNLLVGKTSADDFSSAGAQIEAGGQITNSVASAPSLRLNRGGSDGDIIELNKAGATVGSIGVASSELYFSSGNTGLYFDDVNNLIRPTNSSGALRDNTVDLGKSDSRFKDLYLSGTPYIGGTSAGQSVIQMLANPTNGANTIHFGDSASGSDTYAGYINYAHDSNSMQFATNQLERLRIDSSGNLLVGTTTVSASGTGHILRGSSSAIFTRAGGEAVLCNRDSSNGDCLQFLRQGTLVGSVSVSGTNATFNTSSDQRLKDNIVDAPSASDDIDAIQVRSFDWKADGAHQKYGMVAQELQGVAPEAVTGDADSDDMMGVDYSKLVPMLVKEIQSLRARVAQLETN